MHCSAVISKKEGERLANRKQPGDILLHSLGEHKNKTKEGNQREKAKLEVLATAQELVESPEVFRPRHDSQ